MFGSFVAALEHRFSGEVSAKARRGALPVEETSVKALTPPSPDSVASFPPADMSAKALAVFGTTRFLPRETRGHLSEKRVFGDDWAGVNPAILVLSRTHPIVGARRTALKSVQMGATEDTPRWLRYVIMSNSKGSFRWTAR